MTEFESRRGALGARGNLPRYMRRGVKKTFSREFPGVFFAARFGATCVQNVFYPPNSTIQSVSPMLLSDILGLAIREAKTRTSPTVNEAFGGLVVE